MNYVGPAAGATLGFIQGGVLGAEVGYKIGKYFTQEKESESEHMYNKPRRGRSLTRTPSRTRTRRSKSRSRSRSRSAPGRVGSTSRSRSSSSRRSAMSISGSAISQRSAATSGGGVTSRMASVRRVGSKVVPFKVPKSVKVSAKLRAQVKKIEEGQNYRGTYIATYYGYIAHDTVIRGTAQVGDLLDSINIPGGFNGVTYWSRPLTSPNGVLDGMDFHFFGPEEVMNAAAVLWNQKIAAANYHTQVGNFSSQYTNAGVPADRSAGVKLTVKSAWVDFEIVNNTQRCREVCINICTPKVKFPDKLPLQAFEGAVGNMITTRNFNVGSTNPALLGAAVYGLHPKMLSDFNAEWSYECIKFCIEAGQSVKYKLEGPSNTVYDWGKLYPAGVDKSRQPVKGMSRYVFMTYENDLLNSTLNKVGTLFSETGITGVLSIRYTRHINLLCPENAGFIKQTVVDGTPQQLNLKKNFLGVINFSDSYNSATETYNRVDEENPAVVTSKPA